MSYREIARRTGMTRAEVECACERAIKKLRKDPRAQELLGLAAEAESHRAARAETGWDEVGYSVKGMIRAYVENARSLECDYQ